VLSDDDNKTLHALNENQVYGPSFQITKLECVNHIHKRMGTGLRNLVKTCPHIKGGKGDLTIPTIEKLSTYYRNHIMSNVTESKNSADINAAVKKMKINIMAGLHHSITNDDPDEQHKLCMDESVTWCKYKKQLQDGTVTPQKDSKKLPASFLPHMLPLYQRLSNESLLKRCVSGLTQNQNEAFNATLWRRCPKERNFGTAAVQLALALAVLSWNSGRQGLLSIFKDLGIEANAFTKKSMMIKDKCRLSHACRATEKIKKRRVASEPSSGDYIPGGY